MRDKVSAWWPSRRTFLLVVVLSLLLPIVLAGQDTGDPFASAESFYKAYLVFSGDEKHLRDADSAVVETLDAIAGTVISGAGGDEEKMSARIARSIEERKAADPLFADRARDSSLRKAADAIGEALEDRKLAGKARARQLEGNIYGAIAMRINESEKAANYFSEYTSEKDAEISALDAFRAALKESGSTSEKNSALKGIFDLQPVLGSLGTRYFEKDDMERAGRNFRLMFEAHDLLTKEKVTSFLSDRQNNRLALYYTARIDLKSGKGPEGRKTLEKLFKDGFAEAGLYETLYEAVKAEKGAEAAYPYLEKGRKLLPEDSSLLILEINHFQQLGKGESSVANLKAAIAKQPNNASLRAALAAAYDKLFLEEANSGRMEKAGEYFDLAVDYYKQAVELEPADFATQYGIGALYFNNAAVVAKELSAYENDPSPAATARFDAKLKEVYAQFDLALPYLKKAESIDPNDAKTLSALMQIFDRKGDRAAASEMRRRLAKVQAGGKNETGYFNR